MRHFNQAEIEELRRVLIGDGVRDSEFETVESFTDSDTVAIVQNGKNRKIDLSKLCSRISDLEKEYIDKQDTVTLEQSKSYTDKKISAIPVASTDQFGLVQIGKNLTIKNGVLSAGEQITAEEKERIDGIRTYNGDGSTILRTDSDGNISTFRVGKISQSQVDGLESSFESTLKGVSVTGIPVNVSEDQVADIPLGASLAFSDRINLIWSLFQDGEVSVNNKSIFLQKVNSLPGSGLIAGGIYFDSRAHAICVATSDSEAEVYASGNIANAFLETSESGKKDILVIQYIDDSADLRIDLSQYAIRADVDSSISALKEVIERIKSDVSVITAKIPEAATDTNKLADKDWVNSSIASNTATFRGTFETVADLPVTDIKKNDYAFIIAEDASGNPEYQRYKYDGESWVFEYTLNNSSFTSEQWKSINSGITFDLVAQITTNKEGIAAINTSLSDEVERATTKEAELEDEIATKYTKPDDGIPKADLSEEVQEAINTSGDMFVINEDGSVKLNSKYTGLWTEGFLSARGTDNSGSSGGGANLEAVWKSLKGTEEPFADSVINVAHIPDLDVTKVIGLSQELSEKASKSTVTDIQEQLETKADLVDGKIQESQLPASLAYSQQYTINREVLDDGSFRMTINHGMGKRPTVTVTDEVGNIVDLDIQFTDDNTVRLSWSGAPLVNGKIYIV